MTPHVSIIIPCLNEVRTIRLLLEAIRLQTYPITEMEVVIADGLSTDGTREVIIRYRKEHPDISIHLLDNPKKIIPAGLNIAIKAAQGEIILRLDAHSAPEPDYVEKSVRDLEEGKGDNVGGVWQIQPGGDSWMARAIAIAATHPVGVGDAMYRHACKSAMVDTVPFGTFRRELLEKLGGYDESLLTNEDYELNARIREQGGTIWLDPEIRSHYTARGDLISLAKQYYRYGFWKWQMLKRYPGTIRWRQLLPPVFVLSILVLFIAGLIVPLLLQLLLFEILVYWLILILVIFPRVVRESNGGLLVGFPLSVATMHFCWGTGFVFSIFTFKKE